MILDWRSFGDRIGHGWRQAAIVSVFVGITATPPTPVTAAAIIQVEAEDRAMAVPSEDRTIAVLAEDRTFVVPQETP